MRRSGSVRVLAFAAVAGVAVLTAAGCAGTPQAQATSRAHAVSTSMTGLPASQPAASSAASIAASSSSGPAASGAGAASPGAASSPSTSSAGVPECGDADILIYQQPGGAFMGHTAVAFGFVNTGGHTCYLQGYPGVDALDKSGRVLLSATRTLNGMIGESYDGSVPLTAPPRVVVAPRHTVLAVLEWVDVDPIGGVPGGCLVPYATSLLVTAPDSTQSIKFTGGYSNICEALEINPVIDRAPGLPD